VAVTSDGWRQKQAKQNYRDFSGETEVTCVYDLDRGKDLAMRIRHIFLTAMLAASAAVAPTLAAAPQAAADCISATGPNPLTLCSQGESRKSNTSPVPRATPYIPVDCDVDWLCDQGLGIALSD
jgi:hypothetical protein